MELAIDKLQSARSCLECMYLKLLVLFHAVQVPTESIYIYIHSAAQAVDDMLHLSLFDTAPKLSVLLVVRLFPVSVDVANQTHL